MDNKIPHIYMDEITFPCIKFNWLTQLSHDQNGRDNVSDDDGIIYVNISKLVSKATVVLS